MSKLSKREIVMLTVLIIAIISAGYYNFIFKPFQADAEEISLKINETKSTLSDLKLKKATIKMIDEKIVNINNEMKQKFDHMLYSIDNAAILVMLNKTLPPFATLSDITFASEYQDLKFCYITTINVTFKCDRAGFIKVLTNINNADYVNRIIGSKLSITDPASGACDASVSIEILAKSLIPTKIDFVYP